jgi:hypothetical protein
MIGVIYLILAALSGFAAGVDLWPFLVLFGLLGTGLLLAIVSLPLTRSISTIRKRWLGYVLNGGSLLIYLAVLTTGVSIWLHTTRRHFLVPAGFQGDLYLVHKPAHLSDAHKSHWRTIYRYPTDGILETYDPAPSSFSDEYEYIYPDGHTQKLKDAGPGTLQDTPESRTNTREVVTYFARYSSGGPNQCSMEEISIGTRAFLLSRHTASPSPEQIHPGICH